MMLDHIGECKDLLDSMSTIEWIPIRVLLYKAGIDGKVIDNLIAEWTWFWNICRRHGLTPEQAAMLFKWSHAELWTPDENGLYSAPYYFKMSDDELKAAYNDDPSLKNKLKSGTPVYKPMQSIIGTCWTSTMGAIRDPKSEEGNGTVCRPACQVLKHPERWSVSEDIWLPKMVYDMLIGWMKYKVSVNKGYDKQAIGSFGTPIRFHDHDKEICSEHTHDDVWMAFRMLIAWYYSGTTKGTGATCPRYISDQIAIAKEYLSISKTDVPSPFLLGINLIKSGIQIRDLAA